MSYSKFVQHVNGIEVDKTDPGFIFRELVSMSLLKTTSKRRGQLVDALHNLFCGLVTLTEFHKELAAIFQAELKDLDTEANRRDCLIRSDYLRLEANSERELFMHGV